MISRKVQSCETAHKHGQYNCGSAGCIWVDGGKTICDYRYYNFLFLLMILHVCMGVAFINVLLLVLPIILGTYYLNLCIAGTINGSRMSVQTDPDNTIADVKLVLKNCPHGGIIVITNASHGKRRARGHKVGMAQLKSGIVMVDIHTLLKINIFRYTVYLNINLRPTMIFAIIYLIIFRMLLLCKYVMHF